VYSVDAGTQSGQSSHAFIESCYPVKERSQTLIREIHFRDPAQSCRDLNPPVVSHPRLDATAGVTAQSSSMRDEERDRKIVRWQQRAREAAKRKRRRNLYVITLLPQVLERKDFRQANPGYVEGMPCLYVGSTIQDPGDRFEQHMAGYRSSKYPRHYGVELAQDMIDGFDDAGLPEEERESALAEWLREQGCAVWQN
jgi:hypothetical protein